MSLFTVSCDSTADIYFENQIENEVFVAPLTLTYTQKDGSITEDLDDFREKNQYKAFYDNLREGVISKTAKLNYYRHLEHFKRLLSEGHDQIIHMCISTGLANTYDGALQAVHDALEEYPNGKILVVDSLSATVGEGILVKKAIQMREEGKTLEETFEVLDEMKHRIQHFIVASDLFYLKRGGRVSATSAVLGTLAGVKPMLVFNREGKLEVTTKARGMKKAFDIILENIQEYPPEEESFLTIVHTDNELKAEELSEMILSATGIHPEIQYMGPTIGSHVGPDAVAVSYVSKKLRPEIK